MDFDFDDSAIKALLEEIGGSALLRLTNIFLEECSRNCLEMTQFLSAGDLSATEVVAHRFKSTALQFGVVSLAENCQKLEQACANGQSHQTDDLLRAITEVMPQLPAKLEAILDHLPITD